MTALSIAAPLATRPTVLLVDDDPAMLKTYSRVLEYGGMRVETAQNGEQACRVLDAMPIDLVVSDIAMPGGDGIMLLREMRARELDVPTILTTGDPQVDTAIRAVEHGAFRYLPKPVEMSRLLEAVREALQLGEVVKLQRMAVRLLKSRTANQVDTSLDEAFDRALSTLWMAFQPIVRPGAQVAYGYEALVRNDEPTLVRPDVLFHAAERLGRLSELGRRIRARVARALPSAPADARIFVNLHVSDLADEELYLASAPLSQYADRVTLEVTERTALVPTPELRERVRALRALGYKIAIDDLGAGYASLSSFVHLSPDVVKLDMSLIRDIHKDPTKQNLVRSMNALCRQLGMLVVAEGVETTQERDTLLDLGSDLMQGYLFGRPGSPYPAIAQEVASARLTESSTRLVTRQDIREHRAQLLENLSHAMLTPLNAIIGFTQLLSDGKAGALSADQADMLRDILDSSEELTEVVRSVLAPPSRAPSTAPPAPSDQAVARRGW